MELEDQIIILEFKEDQGWDFLLSLKSPLQDDSFTFCFDGEAILEEYSRQYNIWEREDYSHTYIFRVKSPVRKELKK